ncbi:hypothetical protein HPB51_016080 [Rhipicephalus microplus]|uniref:Adenosine 3'-phospho 5'-phosphosulfate transporter 2 n=1 Tax=Rhipicephalus microplus TaxID=6941 RepID=A0A9J6DHJ4_RHIMP|nr:hypothetical protein HPB51_016080 [Rhipicephalus microplus]
MGNRLRNAKRMREMTKHGASLQQNGQGQSTATTSNSATSQPFTSAASSLNVGRQQHSTAKPQTPPGASQRLSNEKSPQLKSLVAVASKCTTSQNHVRVLDFGNVSSELTQDSSEGASNEASSERVVKAIESIRTSLTGAVNKVLRNSSGGITGPGPSKNKRKGTPHFVICAAGIMVVFLGYGYTQELMFHIEGFKPHGFYLTFVQFVLYSIFAFVERSMRMEKGRTAPLRTHLLLSVLSVGTIGLSNAALGYLNYPTQVLFKCCKLIPVLLGGILIQGKRYNYLDLLAAVLMSIGLAAFILTDNKLSPTFSLIGVMMISTALLFDAVIGNVQEKAMTAYGTPNSEIMIFSYSIGSVILLFFLVAMQDFTPAVIFFAQGCRALGPMVGRAMAKEARKTMGESELVQCEECKRWCYLDETAFTSLADVQKAGFVCRLCEALKAAVRRMEASIEGLQREARAECGSRG